MTKIFKGLLATLMLVVFTACGSDTDNIGGIKEYEQNEFKSFVYTDKLKNKIFVKLEPFADTDGFKDSSAKIFITDENNKAIFGNFSLKIGENYFLTVTGDNPLKTSFAYSGQKYLEFAVQNFYGCNKPEGKITLLESETTVKVEEALTQQKQLGEYNRIEADKNRISKTIFYFWAEDKNYDPVELGKDNNITLPAGEYEIYVSQVQEFEGENGYEQMQELFYDWAYYDNEKEKLVFNPRFNNYRVTDLLLDTEDYLENIPTEKGVDDYYYQNISKEDINAHVVLKNGQEYDAIAFYGYGNEYGINILRVSSYNDKDDKINYGLRDWNIFNQISSIKIDGKEFTTTEDIENFGVYKKSYLVGEASKEVEIQLNDPLANILLTEGVSGDKEKDFNINLEKGKYRVTLFNYGNFQLNIDKKGIFYDVTDEDKIVTTFNHIGGKISIKVTTNQILIFGDYYIKIDKVEEENINDLFDNIFSKTNA